MIDPATRQDTHAIQCIAENAGVFSDNEIKSVVEMLDAFFNPTPDDDHIFVVTRDETHRATGFACYGPTPFTEGVWELYWICVERTRQRNHAGHHLIEHIQSELQAQSARALYLETSEADAYQPARSFYEREGFECVARLDDFYAPGEGKMIFRKRIEPQAH